MQGRPALCQKLEALDGAGLPCFFVEKGKRKNRQNPKRVVVILLILTEHVYISGRVCGGCSSGVVPRGLRGAVREAQYSPSRGLMMTDLDNLKTINDTYGHDWGDIYLRQTAHSLRQNSPGGTVVARLSGGRAGGHRRKGRRGHRRGGTPESRAGRSRVLKSKKYRPLYWHCAGTEGDFLSIFTE